MTAIIALLVDAYRELNAKRLFWVVMAVSALVVAAFGAVGITPEAVTVFGWKTPLAFGTDISPATFYKYVYLLLGIDLWITWGAMILSIISTAGIFPDFLAGGSVDLYLARPISRLRLFVVKYVCGLLFVTLQITVFSLASFLVIGIRGGAWEPGLFLAIPLVVLMFSYLYCVCVLVGVLTRSTVAAMLLTIVFWLALGGIHATDVALLRERVMDDRRQTQLDTQIKAAEVRLQEPDLPAATAGASLPADADVPLPRDEDSVRAEAPSRNAPRNTSGFASALRWANGFLGPRPPSNHQGVVDQLARLQRERAQITHSFDRPQSYVNVLETALPKTSETIALLQRELFDRARLPRPITPEETRRANNPQFRARRADEGYASSAVDQQLRDRPAAWVTGTSLIFEGVILAIAATIFCRRDY